MRLAAFQGNLESTAAYAAGIRAGLAAQGTITPQCWALPGTAPPWIIGLQSLSGMLERGDRVLYVCYDNEAYCEHWHPGQQLYPTALGPPHPGGKATAARIYCPSSWLTTSPLLRLGQRGLYSRPAPQVQKSQGRSGPGAPCTAPCPTGWGALPPSPSRFAGWQSSAGHGFYMNTKTEKSPQPKSLNSSALSPIMQSFKVPRNG